MDLGRTCLLKRREGCPEWAPCAWPTWADGPAPTHLLGQRPPGQLWWEERGRETPVSQGSGGSGESPSAWMEATS